MSRGWSPRGPLQGPVSTVGGEVEEGRLGTEPGGLELSRDILIQFVNDSGKMSVASFSSLFWGGI